jgi:hypothetical protein
MRVVLLLSPESAFPHLMESFPLDVYFYQWLDQNPRNKLIIIGNCRLILPKKYSEKIVYYPVAHNSGISLLSSFRYRLKVWLLLKKINPDRILFDGMVAFSFFSKKSWQSFLFHFFVRSNFLILQQEASFPVPNQFEEDIIHVPSLPSPVFQKKDEKMNDQVKEELTNGTEYLLCTASFTNRDQLTTLLKAYSLFKQRFKTNFKLVLSGLNHGDNRFFSLLNGYKYRQDVILLSRHDTLSLASVLSAAYAHIFCSLDAYYPCTLTDCAMSTVPVIYPEREINEPHITAGLSYLDGNVRDLAEKMMLVYKDESVYKQIIKNMQESFLYSKKDFDFSSYLQKP